ncbi:30S ribosomal protein S20 [Deferribacter thermophilus]|uniref:30S ribosomal protein S20 n=1 Tax=Deferribacter thermophilus TaxID=53573 RepID=UPI003C28206C
MANSLSAKKRIRQNEKRRLRNKSYKSMMKTYTKKFLMALESGNIEEAEKKFNEAVKIIYKVHSKGVIHKNQAARRVSRLAKKLQALKNSAA